MDDKWGADPTLQLWQRWRRPVLITAGLVLLLGQWQRLSSGRPFVVVTGVGLAAFWISVLWRPNMPAVEKRASAAAWRAHARRSARFFGVWTVIACAYLVFAAIVYSIRPLNFVVPAFPALMTAMSFVQGRSAERVARAYEQAGR